MDRSCRTTFLAVAALLLSGCMANVIPERDRALTAGRFSEAAAAAERDIAALEAQGRAPKTAHLFSACAAYSKLKNYEKLFPCLERMEANIARGDVSNVDMEHMRENSMLMRMVPMPQDDQALGNITPMLPLMRGEPSRRSLYCYACSWAYGDVEYERGRPHGLDGRSAGTPTGGDVTCQ